MGQLTAMATDVENSRKLIDLGQDVSQLDCIFPEIFAIILVFNAYFIIRGLRHRDRAGIERCPASIGRRNHDLCFVFEGHIRMDEFRLSSGIPSVLFDDDWTEIRTKYQPVGLPFGNFSWEERTKRILGAIFTVVFCMVYKNILLRMFNGTEAKVI